MGKKPNYPRCVVCGSPNFSVSMGFTLTCLLCSEEYQLKSKGRVLIKNSTSFKREAAY